MMLLLSVLGWLWLGMWGLAFAVLILGTPLVFGYRWWRSLGFRVVLR